ncbi:MAG: hypothetical protein ACI4IQ_02860 [Eubacterium sp.]
MKKFISVIFALTIMLTNLMVFPVSAEAATPEIALDKSVTLTFDKEHHGKKLNLLYLKPDCIPFILMMQFLIIL